MRDSWKRRKCRDSVLKMAWSGEIEPSGLEHERALHVSGFAGLDFSVLTSTFPAALDLPLLIPLGI